MTEQECLYIAGGYQEWPHDYTEKGFQDVADRFYCTIVNQTYIEIMSL